MGGRVLLLLAYQGTRYCGWQMQPNGISVQQVLEESYFRMTGQRVRALAAARTDAGVHAEGQLVVFDNPSRHGPQALREGLNFHLPEDIAVLEAKECQPNFDPRRQAVGKHYRYRIWNARVRPVFERERLCHIKAPLDVDAMRRAAVAILGEHNFSAFCAADDESNTRVRTIDAFAIGVQTPLVAFDVFGRSFLKQMVRNLVGTLVEIGRRRWPPEKLAEILASRDRSRAGPAAPAQGLSLIKVYLEQEDYRKDFESFAGA